MAVLIMIKGNGFRKGADSTYGETMAQFIEELFLKGSVVHRIEPDEQHELVDGSDF